MQIDPSVIHFLEKCRVGHKKIVLATGVFDILHQEHLLFLEKAKKTGDVLIVGLESDVRVKIMKGEGRPINSQAKRKTILEEQKIADLVFILPEEFCTPQDHDDLIRIIHPDILAVSSHTSHLDKKRAIVEKYGGELRVVHQHNPSISTTLILQQRVSQQNTSKV
jgi:rfaE bifunctional protein nucleotidyltransferase chain/domain